MSKGSISIKRRKIRRLKEGIRKNDKEEEEEEEGGGMGVELSVS
jgi:hypothetical protein